MSSSSSSRMLSGLRVAVAGGGVLGLSIATSAALEGARVRLFDPAAIGNNASGVAAGMLSPALEAALEDHAADYPLFQSAYEAWPAFLARLGIDAPSELAAGALYLGEAAEAEDLGVRLAALGAPFRRIAAGEARALQPALGAAAIEGALHLAGEGRLDPQAALPALRRSARAAGVEIAPASLPPGPLADADATVVACGYGARAWSAAAPELARLQPIRGHVLHFRGGPRGGPVVRTSRGYAAPYRRGTVFGATMEAGRADEAVDAAAVTALHAAAVALLPELGGEAYEVRLGVRAAVHDGRPLVGRSSGGLFLATAARRNGWLLAPLIAHAMMEALQGAPPLAAFDPARPGV